jgi:hypothetical protein
VDQQLAAVGAGPPGGGIQTRNASESICSGLPKPNNLGELGQ